MKRSGISKDWPDQVTADLLKELRGLAGKKVPSLRELHRQVRSLAQEHGTLGLVPKAPTTFNRCLAGTTSAAPGLIELIVEVLGGPENWRQRYNHPDNDEFEFNEPSPAPEIVTICVRDLNRIGTATPEHQFPPLVDEPPASSERAIAKRAKITQAATPTSMISAEPGFRQRILTTCLSLLLVAVTTIHIPSMHIVRIDPSAYDVNLSRWDRYGPLYEAQMENLAKNGATHTHVYGEDVGSFYYWANLPELGGRGSDLSARLSSDKPQYRADPNSYSDVTLLVNGKPQPLRRVAPDNGSGVTYTWPIDPSLLRIGANKIEFRVKLDAVFTNGLAIYARAVRAGYADEWITIRTW